MPSVRRVVGCMTGTSIDGIDVALVEVAGRGLDIQVRSHRAHSASLAALTDPLRALADGAAMTAAEIARLSRDYALAIAAAVRDLLVGEPCDLVAMHGQTVFHDPPLSWQLGAGPIVADALRSPVVFDLRAADLAAGGQGAPITPLADYLLLARADGPRTILNLGGFCNYTALPARAGDAATVLDGIRAADICACNLLLDAIARRWLGAPFDRDGRAASSGAAAPGVVAALQERLVQQATSGKSLGTAAPVLAALEEIAPDVAPADVARSACEAIAGTIAAQIADGDELLLAGGGGANAALVDALRRRRRGATLATDAAGLPGAAREAIEIAVLGALCEDGVPITLPHVTGVPRPAPRAGVWARP